MLCENRLYDHAASLHVMLARGEGLVACAHAFRTRPQSYALACPSHCRCACVRAQMSIINASRRARERA